MDSVLGFVVLCIIAGVLVRFGFDGSAWLLNKRGLRLKAGFVCVESDGTLRGTKVYTASGVKLEGVRGVFFDADATGGAPVACIELLSVRTRVAGEPVYQVADPRTGHLRRVDVVGFEGGEILRLKEIA